MKKQAFVTLSAAVLGFLLAFILTQVLKLSFNNIWGVIWISTFVSGISASLSFLILFFPGRFRHDWDLGYARDAHHKLASVIPKNGKINDIIIVAYTANSAYRILEILDKKECNVEHLRVLLRNPRTLLAGAGEEKVIPNDEKEINTRLSQMSAHLMGDLFRGRLGKRVHRLEIKLYNGEPVLRGILIDGKNGFFSIYTKRKDSKAVDYSATNSATLRLSTDGGYQEKILVDFLDWFDLVWEHGSRTFNESDFEDIL